MTNAYMLQFCKSSSTGSYPAMGEYPSVGEGEISPAGCPEGFRGYAYRECHNGVLGEVKMAKCEYKVPDRLQYENNNRCSCWAFRRTGSSSRSSRCRRTRHCRRDSR